MKRLLSLLAFLAIIVGITAPAQATVIFNDWTLDLTGIEGQTSAINNIDRINFNGIGWSQTADTNSNFIPDPSEYGSTDGLVSSMTYLSSLGTTHNWGTDLELTFDFSINSVGTTAGNFAHLAAGTDTGTSLNRDGVLDLWVDDTSDGSGANQSTGLGYADGTRIASFEILGGDGGSFNPVTFDGTDDGTYELTWLLSPGILFDDNGNDLFESIGSETYAIGITDTNFDGDPDNNKSLDSSFGTSIWSPGTQTPVNFLAEMDGSARLGAVPEPATMILLGFGLIGLAGISRKKMRN